MLLEVAEVATDVETEDAALEDAGVGALVLAVIVGLTLAEATLFAFFGEEGNGEFGGTEADFSGRVDRDKVFVLSRFSPEL